MQINTPFRTTFAMNEIKSPMWKMQIPVLKFQKQIFSEVGRDHTQLYPLHLANQKSTGETKRKLLSKIIISLFILEKKCNVPHLHVQQAQFEDFVGLARLFSTVASSFTNGSADSDNRTVNSHHTYVFIRRTLTVLPTATTNPITPSAEFYFDVCKRVKVTLEMNIFIRPTTDHQRGYQGKLGNRPRIK